MFTAKLIIGIPNFAIPIASRPTL